VDPTAPCPVPVTTSLRALRAEADALTPVIAALRPDDLGRATRLPDWDVQVLVAHLVRGVDRIRADLTETLPETPELDWAGYFTTAATRTSGADVSERARAFAGAINDRPVADVWLRACTEAERLASLAPPDRPVGTPFGPIRVDHYLPSRVLEVTVHGLDLRDALDLEAVATPDGLGVSAALLETLLDGDRPAELGDDLAFVLAATGRAPNDDPRLPVLT
jgi:uncharacterized protein (TIGR03083 family)